jgi:VIT1/CCC1 family predicted Fe2+/Mn2+ transporter
MRTFIQDHLDPASRLGEVLFGLIMALGFTGAVRLGHEDADNRALFIGILGCNLAWAIVDGVMYVLTALFERGRKLRLMRSVLAAPNEEAALEAVGREIDAPLLALTTPDELRVLRRGILELVRRAPPEKLRIHREDLFGGLAVALIIAISTLPIVVPYLVFADPDVAVRVSYAIALGLLFLLGIWWARVVGAHPLAVGVGLTLIGFLLVLLTIAMGG